MRCKILYCIQAIIIYFDLFGINKNTRQQNVLEVEFDSLITFRLICLMSSNVVSSYSILKSESVVFSIKYRC